MFLSYDVEYGKVTYARINSEMYKEQVITAKLIHSA